MIWKTAAYLWKISSYAPDSIVFYEAFFGVVTQHSSFAWRHKNAPGVHLGILVGICRDIPKQAKTVTVFRPKRRKNPLGRHITINVPHKGVIVPGKSSTTTVYLNPNRSILIEFETYLKGMAPAAHGPGFHTNSSQSLTDVTGGAWGKHIWFSDPAQFSCHIIRQNTLKKSNNKTRPWQLQVEVVQYIKKLRWLNTVFLLNRLSDMYNKFDDSDQKHITPKPITLSKSSGFLGSQSKFTS